VRPFDKGGVFHPTADAGVLRRQAVRGAGITVFSGGVGLSVQIVATVVLARLLTPNDFGLVTMVTTFSMLLINFGWNGFTEAVIQRETIDRFLVSNLFWINAGAGALLTIGFASAGSLLARFYGDARVAHVSVAMSITIFIQTLSVQHLALLKRAMRFSFTSANEIVSRFVSVVVSILLAWAGWGYWALVAGNVAQALSTCVGAWWLCRWIPSLPRRAAGTAAMVRFAISTYGRFIANYCTWNLDNLLVGWRFGPVSLGFYKKAYDLFALSASQLVAPLTSVAVSALSRLTSTEYRRYLLGALEMTAFVGMAVGADLTLIGKDVIRVLLGPRWDESGRIFMFFGPGIGVMLLYYTHGWIHLSIGRADRWLRWGLVEFSTTAMLFVVGLHWGPIGIAMAWTASFWILTLPALWYAGRPINLGIGPVVAIAWRYLVASLLAAGAAEVIIRRLLSSIAAPNAVAAIARIAAISLMFGVLYLGAVILLHGGFAPLVQLSGLVREMVPGGWISKLSSGGAVNRGASAGAPVTPTTEPPHSAAWAKQHPREIRRSET
jgi:polysaccharide transporter, PST family